MLLTHCDRCRKLIENPAHTWVELPDPVEGAPTKQQVWHIRAIHSGEEADLCAECASVIYIAVAQANVAEAVAASPPAVAATPPDSFDWTGL